MIGILALQGAFFEHKKILDLLDVKSFEIRQKADLNNPLDGLILPGGESTAIGRLLKDLDLFEILKIKINQGLPVFGTCAGLILLANEIINDHNTYFNSINIKVRRNAYGRQLGSFLAFEDFKGIGKIPMTFIRAPYIEEVGENVEILATHNGKIVAAKENNILVTAFHPELTDNLEVHKYFLKMIKTP